MKFISNLILFTLLMSDTPVQTTTIEGFQVIGISVRTINANGQAMQDIEALWTRWWTEKIQEQIPNATSTDIYALYTDYESDYTGAYTMIIGLPVSSLEEIPEGFVSLTVAKDEYKKYLSKGKMPDAIMNTWMEIWQSTNLNRAYRVDFTIHGEKYFAGDQAEVETFISVN